MYLKLVFNSLQLIGGLPRWAMGVFPAEMKNSCVAALFQAHAAELERGHGNDHGRAHGNGSQDDRAEWAQRRAQGVEDFLRGWARYRFTMWILPSPSTVEIGLSGSRVNPESITSLEEEMQNGIQFVSHDFLGMGAGGCPRFLWKCRSRSLSLPPLFLSLSLSSLPCSQHFPLSSKADSDFARRLGRTSVASRRGALAKQEWEWIQKSQKSYITGFLGCHSYCTK